MFDIGFSELLLFGIIALIVLGPEKLPQAARTAGQWYAKLRRAVSTIQSEIEAELDLAETRQQMQQELAKIRQTEADMKREMAELRGSMRDFKNSQEDSLKSNDDSMSVPNQQTHSQQNSNQPFQNQPAEFTYVYGSNLTENVKDEITPADDSQMTSQVSKNTSVSKIIKPPISTRPWENMWFRLGTYDKARRLPVAPYLPNYQADTLLYTKKPVADNLNNLNHKPDLNQLQVDQWAYLSGKKVASKK